MRNLTFLHIPKTVGQAIIAADDQWQYSYGDWRSLGNQKVVAAGEHFSTCHSCHVPPYMWQINLEQWPKYKSSEVFCVIRDPAERMVRTYQHVMQEKISVSRRGLRRSNVPVFCEAGEGLDLRIPHQRPHCTADEMNAMLEYWIQASLLVPFLNRCFLVPQVHYIANPKDGSVTCHHPLPFASIKQDFNKLMASYGIPFEFPSKDVKINSAHVCRGLSVLNLSVRVRSMIAQRYIEDYHFLDEVLHSKRRRIASFRHVGCGVSSAPPTRKEFLGIEPLRRRC
jgi:hypothetical protein